MEQIVDAIEKLDIAQVVILLSALWFFYRRLDAKIEKLDTKLSSKIDKIDEKVADIDKRLFSVERMMHMKECCMIQDTNKMKKAE